MKSKLSTVVGLLIASSVIISCNIQVKENKEKDIVANEQNSTIPNQAFVFQAALDGDIQIIIDALESGLNPNALDENNRTAIMMASYNGHGDIVKLLIENGADVNAIDNVKRTALMYASSGPFTSTVSLLLNAGAKPNMTEKEQNWTAAMMAAAEGQLEVLKLLVASGADLNMVDVDGESAFQFAEANGHAETADYIKTQIKH